MSGIDTDISTEHPKPQKAEVPMIVHDLGGEHFQSGGSSSSSSAPPRVTKSGVPISGMITLELCAGTAGFTAELRKAGFDALGVDHARGRHLARAPCAKIDVTSKSGQDLLWRILEQGRVYYAHAAPPCGTSSRARDKAVPAWKVALGAPNPKKLRSELQPHGIDGLEGLDLVRVLKANAVYAFVAAFMKQCHLKGIKCSIENPKRSYMWMLPEFLELKSLGMFFVNYQGCRHGGNRDKWSSWLTNCDQLRAIAGGCPGGHVHRPWNVEKNPTGRWHFATEDEAAYQPQLCKDAAACILQSAIDDGYVPPEKQLGESAVLDRWKTQASTARQPRGRKLAQLLPEYKDTMSVSLSLADSPGAENTMLSTIPMDSNKKLTRDWLGIPKGSKLLRRSLKGGEVATQQPIVAREANIDDEDGVSEPEPGSAAPKAARRVGPQESMILKTFWGVYATPEQFVESAKHVVHPAASFETVDDCLLEAAFNLLTEGYVSVARKRTLAIKKWTTRAAELQSAEDALHAKLPKRMQLILKGKRLLLMKEMLASIGYPDVSLVEDILAGFRLTGLVDDSKAFQPKFRPPAMSEDDLMKSARWTRHALLGSIRSSGDPDLDKRLYEKVLEEEKAGWIAGPFSEEQLNKMLGPLWVASRRFGLLQDSGAKLRPIDDLSESFVNSCFGSFEKVNLPGVDGIAAIVKALMHMFVMGKEGGNIVVKLSTGKILEGATHADFKDKSLRVVGRALDLKDAYKQFAVSPSSRWTSVMAVYCPESDGVKLFIQDTLPFGASASILAFNRPARAAWKLGVSLLDLLWDNYFDDYPHADVVESSLSSWAASEALMDLIGFDFARTDKKRKPFAVEFAVLGVSFDFAPSPQFFFKVQNTERRVEVLGGRVDDIADSGFMSSPEASEIAGGAQFASAQIFGKTCMFILRILYRHSSAQGGRRPLSAEVLDALRKLSNLLRTASPRVVRAVQGEKPILVFTDGAAEGFEFEYATCGAVIFVEGRVEYWGFEVTPELRAEWGPGQCIGQAELLPVAVSKRHWKRTLEGRLVIFFVDNNSSMDGLVRGISDSQGSRDILEWVADLELESPTISWYSRVPTASNVADGPSRLDFTEVRRMYPHSIRVYPSAVLAFREFGPG